MLSSTTTAATTLATAASSSSSHSQPEPSWLTDEARTVDALLAEIARQAPPKTSSDDPSVSSEKNSSFFSFLTPDSEREKDEEHQTQTSFLPNHAIQPIVRLIRSPDVLRRFLHKFVIARSGRMESAAERVIAFANLLEQYPHLSIQYDLDIIRGLNLNCIECFPFKQCERQNGAVLIYLRLSHLDWDKIEVEQMQKTFFWIFFCIIMMSNHAAQRCGIVLQGDGEDAGPSNIKMTFHLFVIRMMLHCMPVRMKLFVGYNAPRIMRWVVFPTVKLLIPEKMRERIFFVDDHEEIEKRFGFADLHQRFGGPWRPKSIPSEGDLYFISRWISDGRAILPPEVVDRLEDQEKGKDQRDEANGKADTSPRKYY